MIDLSLWVEHMIPNWFLNNLFMKQHDRTRILRNLTSKQEFTEATSSWASLRPTKDLRSSRPDRNWHRNRGEFWPLIITPGAWGECKWIIVLESWQMGETTYSHECTLHDGRQFTQLIHDSISQDFRVPDRQRKNSMHCIVLPTWLTHHFAAAPHS